MAVHDPGDHVPAGQILEVAGRRCRRPHVVVAADRRHPTARISTASASGWRSSMVRIRPPVNAISLTGWILVTRRQW